MQVRTSASDHISANQITGFVFTTPSANTFEVRSRSMQMLVSSCALHFLHTRSHLASVATQPTHLTPDLMFSK